MKKIILLCSFGAVLFAGGYTLQPVSASYQKECGSCHTAYQPEFLPKRSWDKLLVDQNKHFGEDLSIGKNKIEELRVFLHSRSADVSNTKLASRFVQTGGIKISENRYFVREHREISKSELSKKGLKSFANCISCHKGADMGIYDDD